MPWRISGGAGAAGRQPLVVHGARASTRTQFPGRRPERGGGSLANAYSFSNAKPPGTGGAAKAIESGGAGKVIAGIAEDVADL